MSQKIFSLHMPRLFQQFLKHLQESEPNTHNQPHLANNPAVTLLKHAEDLSLSHA